MNELAARFSGNVDFLTVYQKEAHPKGGWEAPDQPNVVFEAANTQERLAVAREFYAKVGSKGQLAVDCIENHALLLFAALPDRIFVINAEHCFVHVQEPGPFGYQPDDLAMFLDSEIRK
mmetsp:Transcript_27813/g.49725  ORF Transcript_27813/g.49725 Transcript_27813/m.49725 type:complete len:119 (-) Transcript_27813:278-634(-)